MLFVQGREFVVALAGRSDTLNKAGCDRPLIGAAENPNPRLVFLGGRYGGSSLHYFRSVSHAIAVSSSRKITQRLSIFSASISPK